MRAVSEPPCLKKWHSTFSSRQIWPTTRGSLQGASLAKFSASILASGVGGRDKEGFTFFRRLIPLGHNHWTLLPLFRSALANTRKFVTTSEAARKAAKEKKKEETARRVYFHRECHPQGPPSRQIQQLFEETVLRPPGKETLNSLEGGIPLDALVLANYMALNLGNILS
ncbi:hypothetical protein ACHAWF_005676 [Thalassiosira exigua]